jgi:hypothetical protein
MKLPALEVWLHHSATAVSGDPFLDMKAIERTGISRFSQFSYSYCVHPDGSILEGCGTRRGAHTANRNSTSFGICWIGDYTNRLPKVQQIDGTRWLIAELVRLGHLKPGTYPTGGHRDVKATACPGNKLYAILADLRVPWAPPPAAADFTDFPGGEDNVRRYDLRISLDDQGRGHLPQPLDVPAGDVVSLIAHGPYPPVDGYWDTPVLGRQERDGGTMVTVTEGPPGQIVLVTLWALNGTSG